MTRPDNVILRVIPVLVYDDIPAAPARRGRDR
jgi:hypothetical protein